jgi:hypothetical protein
MIAVWTAAPCSIGTAIAVIAPRQSASSSSLHDDDAERIARMIALAHDEIVLRLRPPVHVLHAEIPERLLKRRHVLEIL